MDSNEILGKRKRIARLMTYQGQKVYKTNMYSMEDGEKSVWDLELREGAHQDMEESIPAQKPKQKKKSKSKSEMTVPRGRNPSKYFDHNTSIKKDIAQRAVRKKEFIRSHWDLLSPFVEEQATHPVDQVTKIEPAIKHCPLIEQPSFLSHLVELRDYQLAGLNWLISSYCNGINVILGGRPQKYFYFIYTCSLC